MPTIRCYEEIGLLSNGPRTEGGRRVYSKAAVKRLGFIRRCRDFGFAIEQVRELVSLMDELRAKLTELQALETAMALFVCSCDTACAGGPAVDCSILEDLAAPADEARLLAAPSCCGAS